MNRDEIIKLTYLVGAKRLQEKNSDTEFLMSQEQLENLVALVAADYERRLKFTAERWEIECQSQVEIEREACAKFCETHQVWVGRGKRGFSEWGEDDFVTGGIHQGMDYAAAIRARGQS